MKQNDVVQIRVVRPSTAGKRFSSAKECAPEISLAAEFLTSCKQHRERIAIIDGKRELKYDWLLRQASLIASHLLQHADYQPGMHVGLLLKNSPAYMASYYGALCAGAVVVPMPMNQPVQQQTRLCELADIELVIEHPSQPSETGQGILKLNCLKFEEPELVPAGADQLAMMLFTSGSSGKPKAVMLSHRNLLSNARSIQQYLPIDESDRTLAITPFAHALGNSVLQTHVLSGAAMVFGGPTMFPQMLIDELASNQCTCLIGVPELMQSLSRGLSTKKPDLSDLKYLAVAGGRLDPVSARELASKVSPAQLYLMYGQTEATARLAYLPPDQLATNAHTIGKAIPGVELCVRDDSGEPSSPGNIGTLHARGDNIMLGYYNDPETTVQTVVDGWLNTGDLAESTTDGLFQIHGRTSGLIKTQGYRFHPIEVEDLLADELPQLQLIATPLKFFGATRVALFARQAADNHCTIQQIQDVCRRTLPRHMLPQRIELVQSWPLNGAHKIDRRHLQSELESRLLTIDADEAHHENLLCGET